MSIFLLVSLVLKVDLLSRIHHKNLVNLLGYCQDKEKQMLIYEYFPNGSLRDHLYGT
jgi:serine/threonine protein kinase